MTTPALSTTTRAGAMAVARRDGRVTEVTGLTTDRRLVTANPFSGTFTDTLNAEPVRALVGGDWVPLDPTLVPSEAGIVPRASSVGLSISRGGAAELVRLTEGDHAFGLRWPTALPTPVLRGDTAVFPDVRPSIDLVVTARSNGFGEFLVVHDRTAAADPWLTTVGLGVAVPGQVLRQVGGRLKTYDAAGRLTFTSEPVRMWDSAAGSPAAGGIDASVAATRGRSRGRTAPVALRVSGTQVVLTPDRSMLTSPATRFPVVIDPSVAGTRERFATVDSSGKNGAYATTNKDETPWIGLDPIKGAKYDGLVQRIYYGFDVPDDLSATGVKVLGAKFRHLQVKSTETGTDCTKQTDGPNINVWEVHDFRDSFDWDSQPTTVQKMSSSQFVVGDVTSCNKAGYPNKPAEQEWDVLAGVQHHIGDGDDILSFRINEEFDNNDSPSASVRASGRRWYQNSSTDPALVIEYNSAPDAPAAPTVSSSVLYHWQTFVSSTSPLLRTVVRDPDVTQDVTATFTLTPSGGTGTTVSSSPVRGPGATGGTASTTAGQVSLVDGRQYTVSAKANDGLADSAAGPTTTFIVDSSAPGLPDVTGTPTGTVAAGTSITFVVDAPEPDVASYVYGLNTGDPATRVAPTSLGGAVSVPITPRQFGPNFFAVRSYDRAGNVSAVQKVSFKVDGSLPSHRYRLDDSGTDDRTGAAPASTAKNLAVPGATFSAGRDRYAADGTTTLSCKDRALNVGPGSAVPSVSSDQPYPLDTSQAVTVSAWLKPDNVTGTSTGSGAEAYAVSLPASSTATALSLGFVKDQGSTQAYWLFTLTGPAGRLRVESTSNRAAALVTPGRWTHLSGVFDPVAQTATLYVDGVSAARLSGVATTPLTATQLTLGSGPLGSASLQWTGAIDEVLLYQGALSQTSVNQQRNDRRPVAAC